MTQVKTEPEAAYEASERTDEEQAIIDHALSILQRRVRQGPAVRGLKAAVDMVNRWRLELSDAEREMFAVAWLDSQHRVIAEDILFYGSLDGSMAHPRELVRAAISHNAGACILIHNHPSGVTEPSQADISITRRIKEALDLVGTRVLDHIIVSNEGHASLAARGVV